MRVLAIDPGYGRCGIAVLEKTAGKDLLLYSHCIETPAHAEFAARLRMIVEEVERALREYAPACLAMEKLFFNANQKTAMRVAEVRGAILSAAAAAGIAISEYSPGEVKSAAAGDGRADKKQVATMLHMLVSIRKPIRHDDEYDAIAVGVTHLSRVHATSPALRLHR